MKFLSFAMLALSMCVLSSACVLDASHPAAAATTAAAAKASASAKSTECSKEADAKGLQGKPRKKFREDCLKEGSQ